MKQNNSTIRYKIYRECWNEKAFNGHFDNPYWRIEFDGYIIGLKDSGEYWSIINGVEVKNKRIKQIIKDICAECKINIKKIFF